MKDKVVHNWIGSAWGVFFASVTAVSMGLFLGAAELIFRKVEVVESMPRNRVANQRYFVEGTGYSGDDWQDKIAKIIARKSSQVVLSEGDFNSFLRSSTAAPNSKVRVVPNVAIREGIIQLGVLVYPTFLNYPLCFQTKGGFEKSSEDFYFKAQKTYIGALPIPSFLAQIFVNTALSRMFSGPEAQKLVKSWHELSDANIAGDLLRLRWN